MTGMGEVVVSSVKAECRSYAVEHNLIHGVFGGLTADERAGRKPKGRGRRRCRRCQTTFEAVWLTRPPIYCSAECRDVVRMASRRRTA